MGICISSVFTALVVHAVLAGTTPTPPPTFTHIRALTAVSAELIATASTRVPTIRAQLEALERTDVVVYVVHDIAPSSLRPPAFVQFVTAAAGTRYLKLTINCWKIPDDRRLQMLGHELQHALEIAAAPEVRDDRTLTGLYLRIGFEAGPRQFETLAARSVEHRVRNELWVLSRRSNTRVGNFE